MDLFNIKKINNIDFNDLVNDDELNGNSTSGLQNKAIYDLIKRLYLLLKNNGYNDEYFDNLLFNDYRINYLTNNKITLNDIELTKMNYLIILVMLKN